MKKIRLLLFVLIFISIAAKVSVAPQELVYPALTVEDKPQRVDRFFEYKVNQMQSQDDSYMKRCAKPLPCCRA